MRRSRRTAAAVSALALTAGGLVSAAVIGVSSGPALAAPCDPAQQSPQASQSQNQNQQGRRNQGRQGQQDQEQQGQEQDQQQQVPDQQVPDQQVPDQQVPDDGADQQVPDEQDGTDQQAPQGGGIALDPAQSPEDDPEAQDQAVQDEQARGSQAQDPEADDPEAVPEDNPTVQSRRRGGNQPTRSPSPTPTQTQNPDDEGQNPGGGNASPTASPTGTASPSPTATGGADDECADLGPSPEDFVNIRQVAPRQLDARTGRGGSRGTFVSQCGTNGNGHNNPDNFIVAPGVSNGAHHLHDYVGNLSTDAFSTDESLAAAGTTCRQGDKSTYYWPVVRDRRSDANADDPDGNVGTVLRPRSARLEFGGNATSQVVAMPQFMRIITGDAKAGTNGAANARAGWSCSGFQNRISPDKYTLCPRGSQLLRILDFPSCWDGQNTDSANHRTHVVFPDQNGACPQGTKAVPRLRMTLGYTVPQGPSFAVDAFPEQKHNPVTDHGDFVNVMPERLMQTVVSCINRGRRC